MQSNIIQFIKPFEIEEALNEYKKLTLRAKELEAELKMRKDLLISSYFDDHEEYKTSKGLVLATYKPYSELRFQSESFKKDHPEMYDSYKSEKIIFKFLLK